MEEITEARKLSALYTFVKGHSLGMGERYQKELQTEK